FLVGVTPPSGRGLFQFVVTARHVVNLITGDSVGFRVNRKEGDADVLNIPKVNGIFSDNAGDDLAIFNVYWSGAIYNCQFFNGTRETYGRCDAEFGSPAIGEEVFAVGLYTSHHGLLRNNPVIRTGHIAAIPDDEIKTSAGYTRGFLIEIPSLAGLSGSPVIRN